MPKIQYIIFVRGVLSVFMHTQKAHLRHTTLRQIPKIQYAAITTERM